MSEKPETPIVSPCSICKALEKREHGIAGKPCPAQCWFKIGDLIEEQKRKVDRENQTGARGTMSDTPLTLPHDWGREKAARAFELCGTTDEGG